MEENQVDYWSSGGKSEHPFVQAATFLVWNIDIGAMQNGQEERKREVYSMHSRASVQGTPKFLKLDIIRGSSDKY